jgi:hypothetical protein
MARIGSVAAAPFVGGEFVSLYLGAARVPTVPGRPSVTSAAIFIDPDPEEADEIDVEWVAPDSDGGSELLGYRWYLGGTLVNDIEVPVGVLDGSLGGLSGYVVGDLFTISAYNSVGEGPQSLAFPITAV